MRALNPSSLPDDCADRLRQAILDGAFPVGARLPTERALAEQLGVNRGTLRAALGRLVAQGLLTVRQGRGYTVLDYRLAGGPELIGTVKAPLAETAADLLLVRRKLAEAVLERLAARRPDPQPTLDAIEAFAQAVEQGADTDEIARLDAEVLLQLLLATDSPVLQLTLNPIRRVLAELPALREAMYREPHGNVIGWQALAVWLRSPSPAGIPAILQLLEVRDVQTVQALTP